MNEIKLKPCPFCGGEAKLQTSMSISLQRISIAYVMCEECKAATDAVFEYEFESDDAFIYEAIKRWNRRESCE